MRRGLKRCKMWLGVFCIVALAVNSTTAAPLDNGNFDGDLSGWSAEGMVTVETTASGNNAAVLREVDPAANPPTHAGGLSRIYQTFEIPAGAEWLSFRYRLFTNPYGDSVVPPDSFSAILVDPATGNRLILDPMSAPDFSNGLLYQDVRGELLFDPAFVDRIEMPDAEGLYTVIMNILALSDQDDIPARIEFSFANGDKRRLSFEVVDYIMSTGRGSFLSGLDCVFGGSDHSLEHTDLSKSVLANSESMYREDGYEA